MGRFDMQSAASSNDAAAFGNSSMLKLLHGQVVEVYLDEETNLSNGRIDVRITEDTSAEDSNRFTEVFAFPMDIYNYTLPQINESVILIQAKGGRYFYTAIPPLNYYDQITIDDDGGNIEIDEPNLKLNHHFDDSFNVNDGEAEEIFGTTITPEFIEATDASLGRSLHEGDKIIQGRYGGSIKFTCRNELNETPWSLDGEDGQPVIAIRTGEGQAENIAEDNSFIYLLSDQSLDFGDFTPSPESANVGDTYDAYVGSQVVIGADRLTFVSKADDISFSSTGIMSLATPNWAVDLDVLMDQVKALAEQVAALTKGEATFTTGVGPTGPATNAADVATIVQEISGMEQ